VRHNPILHSLLNAVEHGLDDAAPLALADYLDELEAADLSGYIRAIDNPSRRVWDIRLECYRRGLLRLEDEPEVRQEEIRWSDVWLQVDLDAVAPIERRDTFSLEELANALRKLFRRLKVKHRAVVAVKEVENRPDYIFVYPCHPTLAAAAPRVRERMTAVLAKALTHFDDCWRLGGVIDPESADARQERIDEPI
jgi:hypothetical protein